MDNNHMDMYFFTNEHMQQLQEQMGFGIWAIELEQGKKPRMYVDFMMRQLLGVDDTITPEECYDVWYSHIFSTYIPMVENSIKDVVDGKKVEITYPWMNLSGDLTYVRCGAEMYKNNESYVCLHGYHQDVTNIVLMAKEKKQADRFLRYVLNTLCGVYEGIHFVNITTEQVILLRTFLLQEEYDGRTISLQEYKKLLSFYFSDKNLKDIYAIFEMGKTANKDLYLSRNYEECLHGKSIWFNLTIYIESTESEKILIVAIHDVSDKVKLEKDTYERINHLKNQSETDELTRIKNRRSMENIINQYLKTASENEISAFILLDLDNFKSINDTFGHIKGDIVLMEAVEYIQHICRKDDEVGRLGGDEFIIFLKDIKNIENVKRFTQRIICKLKKSYSFETDKIVTIGTSVGIAISPLHGNDFQTLYHLADIALYESKRNGKGRYTIWSK